VGGEEKNKKKKLEEKEINRKGITKVFQPPPPMSHSSAVHITSLDLPQSARL